MRPRKSYEVVVTLPKSPIADHTLLLVPLVALSCQRRKLCLLSESKSPAAQPVLALWVAEAELLDVRVSSHRCGSQLRRLTGV